MFALIVFFIIFSSIVYGWTYGMSYIIIGLFPFLDTYFSSWIIISLLGTTFFTIGTVLSVFVHHRYVDRIYRIGALWLGAITITSTIAIFGLINALIWGFTYTNISHLVILLILSVIANMYGLYAGYGTRIQEYQVSLSKPHNWQGKKIIMVADTHYGNIHKARGARRLVQKINTLGGEIVIIPGDFFDGTKIDYRAIVREFDHITAPHGVIFANGNHEEYNHTDAILRSLTESKIRVINNESIHIDGINFAGVTFHSTDSHKGLRASLDTLDLQRESPTILLKHKPTLHTVLAKYPIDLVVSGHTHRGQMWPYSMITRFVYGKYNYGMTVEGNMTAITTCGVGSWGPPQRIGSHSEIVVIEIV